MGAQQDETARVLLRVAIGAFSLAALVGIAALLSGDFDETQARVAGTALAVSVYAVLAMPGFASSHQPLGLITVGASAVAFILLLGLLWFDWDDNGQVEAWGSLSVVALCLSHATLLTGRRRDTDTEAVRAITFLTVCAIGVVAFLATALITSDGDGGEGLARALGVFAVLDALGTIVLPIARRLGPAQPAPAAPQPLPPPATPVATTGDAQLREVSREVLLNVSEGATPVGAAVMLAPARMADGRLLAVTQDAEGLTFLIEQREATEQDDSSRLA